MVFFFFFQAEDGIRDLVRSRGLGDVYKRQGVIILIDQMMLVVPFYMSHIISLTTILHRLAQLILLTMVNAVSYTHLTLPTSDLV